MQAPSPASETLPAANATNTWVGLRQGIASLAPFLPGILVFGASFGALAAQKGLSLAQSSAMSGLVFAGASQLVALQLWSDHWTIGAIAAVAGVTAAVNGRLLLMSAAFRPWLGNLPGVTIYPNLFTLTDVNWAIGTQYRLGGGRDFGVVIGAGLASWVAWMAAVTAGYLLGSLVSDPRAFGLDLVIVFIFAAYAVPMVRRAASLLPFGIAGFVSIATALASPGYWFIVSGALAGAVTAALRGGDD